MRYLRQYIREMLIESTVQDRVPMATLAADYIEKHTFGVRSDDKDKMGRLLKQLYAKYVDQNEMKTLDYVHWGSFYDISRLIESPSTKSELSTIIYADMPYKPFLLETQNPLGLLVKGHITFAAGADLLSGGFKNPIKDDIFHGFGDENTWKKRRKKNIHRFKSSGWNRYPGPSRLTAPGWDQLIILDPSDVPKVQNLQAKSNFENDRFAGNWTEALVDNWEIEALIVSEGKYFDWGSAIEPTRLAQEKGIPVIDGTGKEWTEEEIDKIIMGDEVKE